MSAEIVKEFTDLYGATKGGSACLVKLDNDYFVVSSIPAAFDHGGAETLAFGANADGEVISWMNVAGGIGVSREKTIAQLETIGPNLDDTGRGLDW